MGKKFQNKIDHNSASLYLFKSEVVTPQYSFQMNPNSFLGDQTLFPKKSWDPGPGSYNIEKSAESHRPKIHGGVKWHKPSWDNSAKFTTPGPADY